ncbi:hypothetical protein [Tunturiibacter gelidiferens]|uniref:hypothetical protein n=1 Tax=Tunturiibacter gelidiferens TaxID=3069689 RepID=UPI003D9B574C
MNLYAFASFARKTSSDRCRYLSFFERVTNIKTALCHCAFMLLPKLAVALSIAVVSANPGTNPLQSSDLHFSAEDVDVKDAVPISDEIWSLLKEDIDVRDQLQRQNAPLKDPKNWFSAAVVHLHKANEYDLVVQGEGPMMGANVTEFWVFAETKRGPKLVLKAPAHDLLLRNHVSNGYRIIEASAVTALRVSTLTYTFDGNHYVLIQK